MTTWILVADSSRARILAAEQRTSPLVELQALVRPEARLHVTELVSDSPGQAFDSGAQGRHGMAPKHDMQEQEAIRFARELSDHLAAAHNRGAFGKLYLIAPPAFLGLLREHIQAPLHALVAGEINKNLANHRLEEIRAHLPDFL
jgi:protein required for attachment to host cells